MNVKNVVNYYSIRLLLKVNFVSVKVNRVTSLYEKRTHEAVMGQTIHKEHFMHRQIQDSTTLSWVY